MKKILTIIMTLIVLAGCAGGGHENKKTSENPDFNYIVDRFADIEILRYQVPDLDKLSPKQKELIYFLSQAALEGRDILYDQNGKYNLVIRQLLEAIYTTDSLQKDSTNYQALATYLKRVWVSNGIHHHYAGDKFVPDFSKDYFIAQVKALPAEKLPLTFGETIDQLLDTIVPVIFDPTILPKRIDQRQGVDMVKNSAENYYDGVTQAEAEKFYNDMKANWNGNPDEPISFGLNSKLVKKNGVVTEDVYKVGGLYSAAIEKIVYWLQKASAVAEDAQQKKVIDELIAYYETGDLKMFDKYCISWVKDTASLVDFVNGFIETYGDPLGMKASWESTVNFKNLEATHRTEVISANAQWFEDHSPVDPKFKKDKVKGVTAKVINIAMLGGDCYPTTPIGINLPNADWIRAEYGSKSVTLENITYAYDEASKGNGFLQEFAWSPREIKLIDDYGYITDNMHTDLHECLGHGSGKLLPGVDPNALKSYSSTIEEARADLFALYYIADPKMVELGLLPNDTAYKAEYYSYFMNGLLTQIRRIELGKDIEEAHMRNRQLICKWVLDKSLEDKAIEMRDRNGKTYVVINDYAKLRQHIGDLLAEIQKIKSTGDYKGAEDLVETYAVKIDPKLHKEVLDRFAHLNIAPYKGFVNPVYTPVFDKDSNFVDLKVDYSEGYAEQNLRYSRDYSPLTTKK